MDGFTLVLVLVVGGIASVLAVRLKRGLANEGAEYKPIVIDREAAEAAREAAEAARAKVESDGLAKPLDPGAPRTKSPTGAPLRTKEPSSGPPSTTEPISTRMKPLTSPPPATTEPISTRMKPLSSPPPTGTVEPARTRTKPLSSAPPLTERRTPTKPPSEPAIAIPVSAHTSSSGPIDLASRLTATRDIAPSDIASRAGVPSDVAIRPPLPEPPVVPDDQIPVAPESGLTIRKRNPSTMPPPEAQSADAALAVSIRARTPTGSTPPLDAGGHGAHAPAVGFAIRSRTPTGASMPSVAAALANPEPVKLRGRLNYALTTAAFSGAGITAHREDGFAKLVAWREVVGIVARRLPDGAPYDGATFIDVVSTAGATLRIVPWTDVTGHAPSGDAIERMRGLLQLISVQCRDAQLDPATKAFLQRTAKAAQLPDEKTLAAHDAKLR